MPTPTDTATVLRFLIRLCVEEADKCPFSSIRIAVERLTGASIAYRFNYCLDPGEAILIDDSASQYELHFNPEHLDHDWINRVRIAHELFHVLESCPSHWSQVFNLCQGYESEDRAGAFACIAETIRPKVAARKLKTKDDIEQMLTRLTEPEQAIFREAIQQMDPKVIFEPPLKCDREEAICGKCEDKALGPKYYHERHHKITAEQIWPEN